jgi:hypothetical protein
MTSQSGGASAGAGPTQGTNYFMVPADSVVRIELDIGDEINKQVDVAVRDIWGRATSGTGGE